MVFLDSFVSCRFPTIEHMSYMDHDTDTAYDTTFHLDCMIKSQIENARSCLATCNVVEDMLTMRHVYQLEPKGELSSERQVRAAT